MTGDELAAIKTRRAAIPPGEYVTSQEFHGAGSWLIHQHGGNRPNKTASSHQPEYAEFFAAAPTDIDALIAEVAALRGRVAALEGACGDFLRVLGETGKERETAHNALKAALVASQAEWDGVYEAASEYVGVMAGTSQTRGEALAEFCKVAVTSAFLDTFMAAAVLPLADGAGRGGSE